MTCQEKSVDTPPFCGYIKDMKRPGRPRLKTAKTEYLELRLTDPEKRAFKQCADLAGIPFSTWVRERVRRAAVRELEEAGLSIPFLKLTE